MAKLLIALCMAVLLASCAVPRFGVPYNDVGPTKATIIDRIRCELVDLIKSDSSLEGGFNVLLAGKDYVASMKLTLKVTHSGTLAPSFSFPMLGSNVAGGFGLSAARTRSHTYTEDLRFSFRELRKLWEKNKKTFGECPKGIQYDLRGKLGLREFVALKFSAPGSLTSDIVNSGKFGGTINFTLNRSLNSAGAVWTFDDFVASGQALTLSRATQHTLVMGFAIGSTEFDQNGVLVSIDSSESDQRLLDEIDLNQSID